MHRTYEKKVTVSAARLPQGGFMHEYITELQSLLETVPVEYRSKVRFDHEVNDYYGSLLANAEAYYVRPMTELERSVYDVEIDQLEYEQKRRDLVEFNRLKERLGK